MRIVIVGAGIVGVSTAVWALRDGHEVTLVDRAGPAGGASFGNGGVLASCAVVPVTVPGLLKKAPGMLFDPDQPLFLRWRHLPRMFPWLMRYLAQTRSEMTRVRARAMAELIGDSLSDHQALAAGTGAERFVIPCDYLYLYPDRAAFAADRFGWDLRAEAGFTWQTLERREIEAHEAIWSEAVGFAVKLPDHGRISDPGAYVAALAAHAEAKGARMIRAEVNDVVIEGGRARGVRAGGETLRGDAVLISTGAWSGGLARKLGLSVPLESERGYHLELWEPSVMPKTPVMMAAQKFVITPMEGRLRLAGVIEYGGLTAPPSRKPFALLERQIRAAIPSLSWTEKTEWMGHRPAISDSLPLIGEAPGVPGAYFGFGHDHVGLTGGPRTGRLLAQLIGGKHPNIDLAPFDPARFQ